MYKRFKELREEKKLTQSQLSRKIKVHVDIINAAENGMQISLEVLKKYAIFFGVTCDYILELTDERSGYFDVNTLKKL